MTDTSSQDARRGLPRLGWLCEASPPHSRMRLLPPPLAAVLFSLLTLTAVLSAQAQQSCPSFPPPAISVTGGVGSLSVTWSIQSQFQSSVDRWQLEYRKTGASNWTAITISDADARRRTITGLEAGTAYQVQIRAMPPATSSCLPGPFSTIATGTPTSVAATVAPSKPTQFDARPGNAEVTLSWADPKDATITRWEYQLKAGSGQFGGWVPISSSGASTTSHTDVTLTFTLSSAAPTGGYSISVGAGGTAQGSIKGANQCTPPLNPADTDFCYTTTSSVRIAAGQTKRTWTLRVLGDTRVEDDETIRLFATVLNSGSTDWTIAYLVLTIDNDDEPPAGVTVSESALTVAEGSTGTYTVTLNAASVTVTVTDDENPAAPVLTGATSTTNGHIAITWTHPGTSVDDYIGGPIGGTTVWELEHKLKGSSSLPRSASQASIGSGNARRTMTLQLGPAYPDGAVVEVRVRATLLLATKFAGPWSNTREVTYKNDNLTALTITGSPVTVTAGSTATYTAALTRARAGTLTVTSGDTSKATAQPATLTFTQTNYATPQTVTVTGVEAGTTTIGHAFRLTGASADAIPDAGTVPVTVNAAQTPGAAVPKEVTVSVPRR